MLKDNIKLAGAILALTTFAKTYSCDEMKKCKVERVRDKKDVLKLFPMALKLSEDLINKQLISLDGGVDFAVRFFHLIGADDFFPFTDDFLKTAVALVLEARYLFNMFDVDALVKLCKESILKTESDNYSPIIYVVVLGILMKFDVLLVDIEFTDSVVHKVSAEDLNKENEIAI